MGWRYVFLKKRNITQEEIKNEELFQKFVESLNLEDEEDYFLHERLMQFKNKENKEQS